MSLLNINSFSINPLNHSVTDGEKEWYLCLLDEQDLPKPVKKNFDVFLKAWSADDLKLSVKADGPGLQLTVCDFEKTFVLDFDLLPSRPQDVPERLRWLIFQMAKNLRLIPTLNDHLSEGNTALTLSASNSDPPEIPSATVEQELKFLRDEVERLKKRLAFERAGNQALLPTMTYRALQHKASGPKLKVKQNSSLLNPTARKRPALGPRFKNSLEDK